MSSQPSPTTSGIVNDAYGAWTYLHCRPAHLAEILDHIWVFDGAMTCLRERTFPNGLLEIIVQLGDRHSVVGDRDTWICPATCVTGLQLQHLVVEAPPSRSRVIGIRLRPAGAYAVLTRPMHEIVGLTVALEDLVGPAAAELGDACSEARTLEGCAEAAIAWVERRLETGARIVPTVAWIIEQIRMQGGSVSIAGLRERTGWSKTRLSSTFVEQIGVSAKQYARVVRFNRALKMIHGGAAPLAEIAAETGYYDQPHLNAEFRELSGFTPTEFLNSHRYANSVSVAES